MPAQFAITLFVSALLLFLVQPMVGKMVLPHVGGSPAVWNTCMVFFQALLLGGYAYAHWLTSLSSQRRQVAIHLGVLGAAVAVMAAAHLMSENGSAVPVMKSLAPRGSVFPFFWVIVMMLLAIGVPFFAVSTSAPLLQRWFTATGHPSSRDPYFLYAASNAGSLISLLSYPILIEPNFRLAHQTWVFAAGFLLLVGLTLLCGRSSMNPVRPPSATGPKAANGSAPAPALWRKWKWVALAFVPSSLMLGITTKMTTDVASVPLLWIIPLTLYLLTFIIAFGRMPSWSRLVLANLTPVVTLLLVFVETSNVNLSAGGQAALHITNFFLLSLLMHGELAHDRPDPKHLTGYFLWISFGGVVGGLFNSLLAPMLFPQLYEYHIAIVIGCLLLPMASSDIGQPASPDGNAVAAKGRSGPDADEIGKAAAAKAFRGPDADETWLLSRVLDFVIPVGLLAVAAGLVWLSSWGRVIVAVNWTADAMMSVFAWGGWSLAIKPETVMQFAVFAPPCMLCFLFIDRPVRFGLCVLAVLFAYHYRQADHTGIQQTIRSYFGVMRIDAQEDIHKHEYMPKPVKRTPKPDGGETVDVTDTTYSVKALIRSLSHGTTLHGKQYVVDFKLPMLRDQVRPLGSFSGWDALALAAAPQAWDHSQDPLTYYHRTGPVGDLFREGFRRKRLPRVGMVGLGTGSVAAYAVAGQKFTFYEIDKAVKDMIESGDRTFSYVTDARERGADVDIVLGDARLTLEEHTDRKYDLLLIDAFSSDSIPTHLLTVEAVRMYRDRLAENGLLAMHVSNRYLRLEPVVQAIADELGMVCRLFADENDAAPGKTSSSWVVLARNDKELGAAFANPPPPAGSFRKDDDAPLLTWRPILPHARIPAWTDDYMDVLRVTKFAELQYVRRQFGLEIPVRNWEEKTKFVDRQYRKPPADRLYGLQADAPDLQAVSRELDRVLERKAKLKADELEKPSGERRFDLKFQNPDAESVSEKLDDEIERLEDLDAKVKRKP